MSSILKNGSVNLITRTINKTQKNNIIEYILKMFGQVTGILPIN